MNDFVKQKILDEFDPQAEVIIQGLDCNLSVEITSKRFEGMKPLDRQRLINALFKSELSNGKIHALSLKTRIPK